jgi:rfaE bifunctional protein nucleotidyltransferase chain/domain
MKHPQDNIISLSAAAFWRADLRRRGADLVVCNGCYDLLHAGHVRGLIQARRQGDALLVLLNSDASVRALKGPTRPLIAQDDRAILLASLSCVTAVVLFDEPRCSSQLTALGPDIYCISEQYRQTQDPTEAAALAACGAAVHWLPVVPGLSTTALIARCASLASPAQSGAPTTPGGR